MLLKIIVEEMLKLTIGIFVLILGIPLGKLLSKITLEEMGIGKPWFKIIVLISFIGGMICLFLKKDFLMFGFFFITIVTTQSIK